MPSFPIRPDQIRFLASPVEFYEFVKNGISASQSRIVISSLYFGTRTANETNMV